MKTVIIGLLAVFTFLFTSCKNNEKTEENSQTQMDNMHTNQEDAMMENMKMSSDITITETGKPAMENLSPLYANYFYLTTAFTKDDAPEAAKAAKAIIESLASINKSGFSEEQKKEFSNIEASIKEHAEQIASNTDDITLQRKYLDLVGADFYNLVKVFGTNKPIYRILCPMFNENKEVYWLSTNKDINNPYFGSKMSTCGIVKEEIK